MDELHAAASVAWVRRTCSVYQTPPLGAGTPRRFSSRAIAAAVWWPAALSCSNTGATAAARAAAAALAAAALAAHAPARYGARCAAPLGFPNRTPRAFAAASAALVRSDMATASCSAIAAIKCSVSLFAKGRSTHSKGVADSISAEMVATDLASLSNFAITNVARCSFAAASAAASCGRSLRRPLSTSTYSSTNVY